MHHSVMFVCDCEGWSQDNIRTKQVEMPRSMWMSQQFLKANKTWRQFLKKTSKPRLFQCPCHFQTGSQLQSSKSGDSALDQAKAGSQQQAGALFRGWWKYGLSRRVNSCLASGSELNQPQVHTWRECQCLFSGRWFPSGQRKGQLLEYTHSTLSVWSLETGEPFVLILDVCLGRAI